MYIQIYWTVHKDIKLKSVVRVEFLVRIKKILSRLIQCNLLTIICMTPVHFLHRKQRDIFSIIIPYITLTNSKQQNTIWQL